jgi:hypothetical protein
VVVAGAVSATRIGRIATRKTCLSMELYERLRTTEKIRSAFFEAKNFLMSFSRELGSTFSAR